MGIGSLTLSSFASPLQVLSRWLAPRALGQVPLGDEVAIGNTALGSEQANPCKFAQGLVLETPAPHAQRPDHPKAHAPARSACLAAETKLAHRPLPHSAHALRRPPARQVLRVVHSSCNSGFDKLFISGRMADVCAELDRLAARETLA